MFRGLLSAVLPAIRPRMRETENIHFLWEIKRDKKRVTDKGNIRNTQTKKPLATYSNNRGKGYRKTKIYDTTGTRRSLYVHQLVAYYFIGKNKSRFIDVDHIDNNPNNNAVENLQYLSHGDNVRKIYKK